MKKLEKLSDTLKNQIRGSGLSLAMLEKRTGVSQEIVKDFYVSDNMMLSHAQALASFFGLELALGQ